MLKSKIENHQCFISKKEMDKYWSKNLTLGLLMFKNELEIFIETILPIIGSSFHFYFHVHTEDIDDEKLVQVLIFSSNQQCYYQIGFYSHKHIFSKQPA